MQTYDEKVAQAWQEHQAEMQDADKECCDAIREAQEKLRRRIVASYERYQKIKEKAFKGEEDDDKV